MPSAILECTAGKDLISSRFNRTAAIKEAAMSVAAFGFFSSAPGASLFWCSTHVALGNGWPWKISVGL